VITSSCRRCLSLSEDAMRYVGDSHLASCGIPWHIMAEGFGSEPELSRNVHCSSGKGLPSLLSGYLPSTCYDTAFSGLCSTGSKSMYIMETPYQRSVCL
jgi:hypothetical protein